MAGFMTHEFGIALQELKPQRTLQPIPGPYLAKNPAEVYLELTKSL